MFLLAHIEKFITERSAQFPGYSHELLAIAREMAQEKGDVVFTTMEVEGIIVNPYFAEQFLDLVGTDPAYIEISASHARASK